MKITNKVTLALAMALNLLLSSFAFAEKQMDIREYVQQVFVRGVPYNEAREYSASSIPALAEMLRDPEQSEHWANIVVMMEIIGDESVLKNVVEFIERDPGGEYTQAYHRAKTGAIMGLGYLIHNTKSKKALAYLKESLRPGVWQTRGMEGLSRLHSTAEERDADFSKYGLLGLALAGTPESAAVLGSLKSARPESSGFKAQDADMLDFLLEQNNNIARKGMEKYNRDH